MGHTLRNPSKKIAVNKLNHVAAGIIASVRRSSPIKALEVIYDLSSRQKQKPCVKRQCGYS